MIAAKNAVLDNFGVKIEESTVEQILRFGTADISASYLDCITAVARQYVTDIFATLRKYEYNPGLMRLYVVVTLERMTNHELPSLMISVPLPKVMNLWLI